MWTWPVVISVSTATRLRRVLREQRVEDRVADLVADLVGVALGHGLGGEEAVGTRYSLSQRLLVGPSDGQRGQTRSGTLYPGAGRGPLRRPGRREQRPRPRPRPRRRRPPCCPPAPRVAPPVGVQDGHGVVGAARRPAPPETSLTTSRSQPLRASLARACVEDVAVGVAGLGGEADDQLAGGALGDELGEDVGVADQRRSGGASAGSPVFLILLVGHVGGPEVGDGGGHHDDVGARGGRVHRLAQLFRGADRARRRPRPGRAARRWRRRA